MKTSAKLVLYLLLLASTVTAAEFSTLMTQLKSALPAEWEIAEVVPNKVPAWSRRGMACTKIILVGPRKSGYRYYDAAGTLIAEHFSMREAISVWVAEPGFDMGWSTSGVIKNRFSKVPVVRPVLLYGDAEQVFGLEELFSTDATYSKDSPKGTAFARGIEFDRSWPEWRRDIRATLKTKKAPNQSPEPTSGLRPAAAHL